MADDVLTLHEAAEELGVHYMSAYRYVRLGLLDATKRGGVWKGGTLVDCGLSGGFESFTGCGWQSCAMERAT